MTTSGSSSDGRLFLAILPDDEAAARIHRVAEILKSAHGFRAQLTARDRLHVTLLFDDRAVEKHPIGPIGWTVRHLVLIHSMKGHQHLARWPLHV